MPEKLERLDVKEAADFLGVSQDVIYRMVRERQIPHFRVRSKILFCKETILDWIKDQEQASQC